MSKYENPLLRLNATNVTDAIAIGNVRAPCVGGTISACHEYDPHLTVRVFAAGVPSDQYMPLVCDAIRKSNWRALDLGNHDLGTASIAELAAATKNCSLECLDVGLSIAKKVANRDLRASVVALAMAVARSSIWRLDISHCNTSLFLDHIDLSSQDSPGLRHLIMTPQATDMLPDLSGLRDLDTTWHRYLFFTKQGEEGRKWLKKHRGRGVEQYYGNMNTLTLRTGRFVPSQAQELVSFFEHRSAPSSIRLVFGIDDGGFARLREQQHKIPHVRFDETKGQWCGELHACIVIASRDQLRNKCWCVWEKELDQYLPYDLSCYTLSFLGVRRRRLRQTKLAHFWGSKKRKRRSTTEVRPRKRSNKQFIL